MALNLLSYEAGGAAYHSQAAVVPVIPSNGKCQDALLTFSSP